MDHSRFDRLTRALGGATTRRAGLKAALGGLLGLGAGIAALPAREGAARKHKKKRNALCPTVCPSGSACTNGQCACTREICGGTCCAGNQTCQNGTCATTGLRDCSGVAIHDGADLSYCSLPGATIPVRTLRNANFEGADLTGAKFTGRFQPWGCSFRNAVLANASLFECDIKPETTFEGADLRGADLRAGHIDGADFGNATLTQARFGAVNEIDSGTRISNSRFAGADLAQAGLRKTHIHSSDLGNANLAGADLWAAEVGRSDLSGAALTGADLRGANIVDAALEGALLDRALVGRAYLGNGALSTRFTGCSMVNANMRDQKEYTSHSYAGIRFANVRLSHATFSTPYGRDTASWLDVDLTGASGWQQPAGGYAYLCNVTLPDGTQAPNTSQWNGAACP